MALRATYFQTNLLMDPVVRASGDPHLQCCAGSMVDSEYWVMRTQGTWQQLELECRYRT